MLFNLIFFFKLILIATIFMNCKATFKKEFHTAMQLNKMETYKYFFFFIIYNE